jgi:long-chain acyl-CoA synthetase
MVQAVAGKTIAQPDVESADDSNLTASTQRFKMQHLTEGQQPAARSVQAAPRFVYPHWPWLRPMRWVRAAFVECLLRPLVWLLGRPRITGTAWSELTDAKEPMLIVANHVTVYDVPLLLFALPRAIRDRTAVAMSGEMLDDFRHARNMQSRWLNPLGPPTWLLLTGLFNAFPLPRQRDFQRSFAHAGEALDRGFHVIVFPEGTRSADGTLAKFRPGIGLLAKLSFAPILPMALRGLGDLKTGRRSWFRSGTLEVRVGQPIRFAANETEATVTARLHAAVQTLLAP